MEQNEKLKLGEKGAWLSILSYIILSIVKLTVGSWGNSEGLWADGLNNTTDIIASVAVLVGLKISRRPPDDNHLYGHTKAEYIASLVSAFIMISVGLEVIFEGIQSFFNHETAGPDWLTAWVALISAAAIYAVYRYNLNLANKIGSPSIKAVAYDNRSDAFVSLGAFVGILGSQLGLYYLDTIAAVIVGVIICRTAWEIFKESSHLLTDGIDTDLLTGIKETIEKTDGVIDLTELKGRMHGSHLLVEATIHVNPSLNVVESHDITEEIEQRLLKKHNVINAFIHIEPYQEMN